MISRQSHVRSMKVRQVILSIFWLILPLVLQSFSNSPAFAEELSVKTHTRSGPLLLTVRFKEGYRDWAQFLLDESPKYIRRMEQYMKSPLEWTEFMVIEGCDNCTSQADLANHKIYLNYLYSTTEDVSVLFHEINHFWFYYYVNRSSENWLIEGISSFLPNALRDKNLLADKPLYHEVIDRYWGLDWPFPSSRKDVPMYPINNAAREILYAKSYKLQYLFHCILGEKHYRSFVRRISSLRRRRPSVVIATLNRYKKANWKRILSGWVLGRKYTGTSLDDFTNDGDSDGLSRAKEYCFKSSPKSYDTDSDYLPDGAEVTLGRNPGKADKDGWDLLLQYGPFTDGNDSDWTPFRATVSVDPSGDEMGPGWADMQNMFTMVRNDTLHVLVKTASRPEKPEPIFFDILVDTDSDSSTDEEFAFFLYNPTYPWHYSVPLNSDSSLAALEAASGDYIEMAIPLSAIPSQSFRVLPIIRNNETKQNYDEWGEWVTITR